MYFWETKKWKKIGVFTKARGGGRGTIFKLLGILQKITDGTNGERCILFSRFSCIFEEKKKEKKVEFSLRRAVVVVRPFSNFRYPSENT